MNEEQDQEIVKQCLNGNTEAFEYLIDRYQKAVFNLAHKMVQNYEDARDLTQVIFIKAFEKLKQYNPKFKFFSWLYRIAINETINFIHQKRPHEEMSPMIISKQKTPDKRLENSELSEMVSNALMKLNPEYRIVILLKHFEGFSYEEIGYILNIPIKVVKSRLYTARQLLRTILIKNGLVTNE